MIACPSKTLFSRVFPSGVGVRSIIAGIRPFAVRTISIFVFKPRGISDVSFQVCREKGKEFGHVTRERGARRTVDLQVPIFLLHILWDVDMCCFIFDTKLLERD